MLNIDPNGLQMSRVTMNPGKCFPIFRLNSPGADVPLIVDGGYTHNGKINRCQYLSDQINFLHPRTEGITSGTPTQEQFLIGVGGEFLSPIFEIGVMPINTLRMISDVPVTAVIETFQGGYTEFPTYPVDVSKTTFILTDTTTITAQTNWQSVLVLPALPRAYFRILISTYTPGSNLVLYLHSEISM